MDSTLLIRRAVPHPKERETLVMNLHRKLGHWGLVRTVSMVRVAQVAQDCFSNPADLQRL